MRHSGAFLLLILLIAHRSTVATVLVLAKYPRRRPTRALGPCVYLREPLSRGATTTYYLTVANTESAVQADPTILDPEQCCSHEVPSHSRLDQARVAQWDAAASTCLTAGESALVP